MSSVEVGRYKRAVLLLVVCPSVPFSPPPNLTEGTQHSFVERTGLHVDVTITPVIQ